jgi:hypothetical protein
VATTVTAASATATTAHACRLRAKLIPTPNRKAIVVAQSGGLTGVFIKIHFLDVFKRPNAEPKHRHPTGSRGASGVRPHCNRLRPVAANGELIHCMEAKVKAVIDRVWDN